MRLERDRARIAIVLQRAELTEPIDDALAHRRPIGLPVAGVEDVLAVQMTDAVLGERL